MCENPFDHVSQQREWLQNQLTALESRLRRRLHGKLRAVGWFDVDDVLSSARGRL
jgi:hypothetical protein